MFLSASLTANEEGEVPQLACPRLSVCADAQKVDRAKLSQTEVGSVGVIQNRENFFAVTLFLSHVHSIIPLHSHSIFTPWRS